MQVDPIELVVWLPAVCKKMGVPYLIVKVYKACMLDAAPLHALDLPSMSAPTCTHKFGLTGLLVGRKGADWLPV